MVLRCLIKGPSAGRATGVRYPILGPARLFPPEAQSAQKPAVMTTPTAHADTSRRGVWIAAGLSVGVHMLAAGALGLERAVGLKGVTAEIEPQPPEASETDNEVAPGIDNGRRLAVAWLGFEDPTEHTAPQSTTEQAALTPDPGGLVAPADVVSPTPEPPAPETPPVETIAEPEPEPAESFAPALPIDPPEGLADPIPEPSDTPNTEPTEAIPEQPTPTPTATPGGGPEPTDQPGRSSVPGDAGEADDRFSTPTALERAIDVQPGRPAAREGLEVITKFFPIWQNLQISTRPNNPVVRLTFNAEGKVSLAEFVVEEGKVYSTGSPRYDETVLNGLYTWTARGDRIDELKGAEPKGDKPEHSENTVSIVMRIIIR